MLPTHPSVPPPIGFVFLKLRVCLGLPSDFASRQRPCRWLAVSAINPRKGLVPSSQRPCWAYNRSAESMFLPLRSLHLRGWKTHQGYSPQHIWAEKRQVAYLLRDLRPAVHLPVSQSSAAIARASPRTPSSCRQRDRRDRDAESVRPADGETIRCGADQWGRVNSREAASARSCPNNNSVDR